MKFCNYKAQVNFREITEKFCILKTYMILRIDSVVKWR